jgi:hypothetical protein
MPGRPCFGVGPHAEEPAGPGGQGRVNPRQQQRKAPTRAAVASRSGLHLHVHPAGRSPRCHPDGAAPANPPAHHSRQRLRDPPHTRGRAPARPERRTQCRGPDAPPSLRHTKASQSAQADFVWLLQQLQSPVQLWDGALPRFCTRTRCGKFRDSEVRVAAAPRLRGVPSKILRPASSGVRVRVVRLGLWMTDGRRWRLTGSGRPRSDAPPGPPPHTSASQPQRLQSPVPDQRLPSSRGRATVRGRRMTAGGRPGTRTSTSSV